MRVSLSNSILLTLTIRGRVMGDKSNEIGTKVLLGHEYADSILLRGLFFQGWVSFNEPEISDLVPTA